MLPVGGTAALTVTGLLSDGTPADLGQARIDYASDNGQVATVDEGGTVSAAAEGTANVTAAVTMGGVTRTASLAFAVDGTPPTFSLSAGGEPLVEGASFEDTAQLAFHAGDSLSGLSSASVSIDGQIYALDPQDEGGLTVDLSGQVGSHTATVAVEDTAGNRLEQTIAFTVTTSIDAMKLLLERYGTADTKQVLGNHLDQAQHQLDKGKPDHAAKHMQDFLKHLNNEALAGGIDAAGQSALTADADALIVRWTN
jgi:hypothetical protein